MGEWLQVIPLVHTVLVVDIGMGLQTPKQGSVSKFEANIWKIKPTKHS